MSYHFRASLLWMFSSLLYALFLRSDYDAYAPPNSYIHISDFDSPFQLAVYLKYLIENPGIILIYMKQYLCLSVLKNLSNCWTNMFLIYNPVSPSSCKRFQTIFDINGTESVSINPKGSLELLNRYVSHLHHSFS